MHILKILFDDLKLDLKSRIPGIKGSIGAELLKVHVSYGPVTQALLRKFNRPGKPLVVKGMAHITGGGFIDNMPRVLPKNCNVEVRKETWPVLPIFKFLQEKGNVSESEVYQVFNMGIGMTLFVDPAKVKSVIELIGTAGQNAWEIGSVTKGNGVVKIV